MDVQDDAIRWILGVFWTTPAEPLVTLVDCHSPNPHLAPVTLKDCSTYTTNHPAQLTANLATRSPVEQRERTMNSKTTLPLRQARRLASLVPQETRPSFNFQLDQRAQLPPRHKRLYKLAEISRGEDRKQMTTELKHTTENRHNNTLILFRQGSKPDDREVGHRTESLGTNTSSVDAACEAILLATNYIRDSESLNHGRLQTRRDPTNRRLNSET